jgi:hypothetical protein
MVVVKLCGVPVSMLILRKMDYGGSEEGSFDAVLECPAPATFTLLLDCGCRVTILFRNMYFGACWRFVVEFIWLFVCQHAVVDMIG